MSFLLDPGLLIASGVAIEKLIPERHRATVELATAATFMGISGALYLNAPGLGAFWKPFGSRNGRDFMVNSGVLHLESTEVGPATHLLAATLWSSYPLLLRAGRRLGRRLGTSAHTRAELA